MSDYDDPERRRLIARAIVRYSFRIPRQDEDPTKFVEALIEHVALRDFADAHEIVVGRRQPEWTPEDVRAFTESLAGASGPMREFPQGMHRAIAGTCISGFAPTDECLADVAKAALDAFVQRRCDKPRDELPITVSMLLLTGELLAVDVSRSDRVAMVRHLAQSMPAFGFVVIGDYFLHGVLEGGNAAVKHEAIIAVAGTRTTRTLRVRTYTRSEDGETIMVDEPHEDQVFAPGDPRDMYAGVFVSVPPPGGRPS